MKQVFNGVVRREVVAKGSKSEHTALVLETAAAQKLTLRVRGTNAFEEPAALKPFVDQRVRIQGVVANNVLFVGNIQAKR